MSGALGATITVTIYAALVSSPCMELSTCIFSFNTDNNYQVTTITICCPQLGNLRFQEVRRSAEVYTAYKERGRITGRGVEDGRKQKVEDATCKG